MEMIAHSEMLPLLDGFGAAWDLVNAAAVTLPGGTPVVVLDGVDRAGLAALRVEVAGRLEAVRAQELAQRIARGLQEVRRDAVQLRLGQFLQSARSWWGRGAAGAAIPTVALPTAALDKFLRPVRQALRLWGRLNAEGPVPGVVLPLTVGSDGFTRADLADLQALLLAAREEGEEAEFLLLIRRAERETTERRARAVLSAFKKAAEARLGSEHPAVRAAPRLYPLPGHTPEPVTSAGAWEAAAARLTWEASADEKLSHYEVRWCRGDGYDKKKERAAGRVERDAPRVLLTSEGLARQGAAATFRVYVVLRTGNERAGNPVTVWRPAAVPPDDGG